MNKRRETCSDRDLEVAADWLDYYEDDDPDPTTNEALGCQRVATMLRQMIAERSVRAVMRQIEKDSSKISTRARRRLALQIIEKASNPNEDDA